jgi:hypothetical protein
MIGVSNGLHSRASTLLELLLTEDLLVVRDFRPKPNARKINVVAGSAPAAAAPGGGGGFAGRAEQVGEEEEDDEEGGVEMAEEGQEAAASGGAEAQAEAPRGESA